MTLTMEAFHVEPCFHVVWTAFPTVVKSDMSLELYTQCACPPQEGQKLPLPPSSKVTSNVK